MKKKDKSDKKSPGDFKNNPFKPLKGFTPESRPAGDKIPPPPAHKPADEEDDASLFLRAAAGARRIGLVPTSATSTSQRDAEKSKTGSAEEDQQLFLRAFQKIGATSRIVPPEPDEDETELRSSMSRMRQLKRGMIRISEELDLHGEIREDALVKLEQFLAGAFRRGQKAVLIITGKGINSPEGPVLQGAVASWLRGNGKALVAEFAPAPRALGGSGAFVVFLKNG